MRLVYVLCRTSLAGPAAAQQLLVWHSFIDDVCKQPLLPDGVAVGLVRSRHGAGDVCARAGAPQLRRAVDMQAFLLRASPCTCLRSW